MFELRQYLKPGGVSGVCGKFPYFLFNPSLIREVFKNIGLLPLGGFCLLIILKHTYFFQFLGGGTLLSLDLGPTGVSNL